MITKFLWWNWLKAAERNIFKFYYPGWRHVDAESVSIIGTDYGLFRFCDYLKANPDLFRQVELYNVSDLTENDVVLDIGANIGAFTIKVAKQVKHVYAVEPIFCNELRENVYLNNLGSRVTVLPFALGKGGQVEIDVSFGIRHNIVEALLFKDILAKCKYPPTFLKMDCEGGEWCINPFDLIEKFSSIEGEFHSFDTEGNKCDMYEWLRFFEAKHFKCVSQVDNKQLMLSVRKG